MRRGGKVDLILSHQPETIFKENGELIQRLFPVGGSTSPIGSNVSQRQKDQFCSCLITWEMAARLDEQWEQKPDTRNLQLAVNISARQFHQLNFVDEVLEVLQKSGADRTS